MTEHKQLSVGQRKALVKANVSKFGIEMKDVNTRNFTVTVAGKYTIVEIERKGKHYTGLSSQSCNDTYNWYTGVAIAFNRAFKCMVESEGLNEASKKKKTHKELIEMMIEDAYCDISKKHQMLVVRTPHHHDDFLDALRYMPPATMIRR